MQAVVIHRHGPPEVLEFITDYPLPTRAGRVLVRLRSSSVNPSDAGICEGFMGGPLKFPKILGGDLAGIVEEADASSKFKKGDAVAALAPGYYTDTQEGTYAQYAAVEEDHLARLPEGVSVDTAGGVPLVALTAWQALMAASPHQGQRLLVFAASGGVGHIAVQLGKALGLYVVGVAGPSNAAWVKEHLGADEVVDYSKQDITKVYAEDPFDIVMDCLADNVDKSISVLKPSGHYSHIGNAATNKDVIKKLQDQHKQGKGPSTSNTLVQPNGAQLAEIFELIAAGKVKLEVAKVFPLSDVAEAHRQVKAGHTRGKVVLSIP
eukprot:GHRR01003520.1.p1 GENE.GHRR01003520.1~~GHRR01003520.1.p1  ORF type:complete len:321 (+),score=105.33 GHRR01003520.1:281-1243(+)